MAMNRKWKKQLCWEGFMAGIWALCHIKIRGTVIRFEKALWRITSLKKKKRHTVIVSDCFEIASQPTSADRRYGRYQNVALTLKRTRSCRVIGRRRRELGARWACAPWEYVMDVCSTVFIDLKLHPGKTFRSTGTLNELHKPSVSCSV